MLTSSSTFDQNCSIVSIYKLDFTTHILNRLVTKAIYVGKKWKAYSLMYVSVLFPGIWLGNKAERKRFRYKINKFIFYIDLF